MNAKEKPVKVEKITPGELFKDAEFLYQEAIEELARGKVRNAAEKAWGATQQATNALIVSRTGEKPETSAMTRKILHELALANSEIEKILIGRFHTRQAQLHGDCFYNGLCEPKKDIERRVRDTLDYIKDARKLANTEHIK